VCVCVCAPAAADKGVRFAVLSPPTSFSSACDGRIESHNTGTPPSLEERQRSQKQKEREEAKMRVDEPTSKPLA
jgi:hypothetical protein